MDRELRRRVVQFLEQHIGATAADREAVLSNALHGCLVLRQIGHLEENTSAFVGTMVDTLYKYGRCDGDTEPSLVVLMRYIGSQKGPDVQAMADALCGDLLRDGTNSPKRIKEHVPAFLRGSYSFRTSLLLLLLVIAATLVLPWLNGERLRWLAQSRSQPVYIASLNLYMEPFEVTVERYHMCVEAEECKAPLEEKDGEKNPYYVRGSDQFPAVAVSSTEAFKFCRWIDRRLPTVQEWLYVARGGESQTDFPWSDELPDSSRANLYYESRESSSFLEPVGGRPGGAFRGIHDLIGNASEWTVSVAESGNYEHDSRIWISLDNLPNALYTVGGSYSTTPEALQQLGTMIASTNASALRLQIGFRCVQ